MPYSGEVTPFERVMMALEGKRPDRVPVFPLVRDLGVDVSLDRFLFEEDLSGSRVLDPERDGRLPVFIRTMERLKRRTNFGKGCTRISS